MNEIIEAKGFTPVFDTVAGAVVGNKKMGLVGAAVYGIVWRKCQLRRRVCDAAIETMADQLGVNRRTIERHLKALCKLGYIEDLTPDRRNGPHTYVTTGKVTFRVTIEAGEQDPGETESHTDDSVRQRVEPVRQRVEPVRLKVAPEVGLKVAQGDSFKETNKETNKERENRAPAQNSSSSQKTAAAKASDDVHPAIKVVKAVNGKDYPHPSAYQTIIEAVGDDPANLARWKATLVAGLLKGWKESNIDAPLDYFGRGEIPGQNGHNGSGRTNIAGLKEKGSDSPLKKIFNPQTGETYWKDARTGQTYTEEAAGIAGLSPDKVEAYKRILGEEAELDSVYPGAGIDGELQNVTSWFKEAGGTNDQVRQNRTLFVDLLEKHRDTKTFREIGELAYDLIRQNEHLKSLDVMNGGTPRL